MLPFVCSLLRFLQGFQEVNWRETSCEALDKIHVQTGDRVTFAVRIFSEAPLEIRLGWKRGNDS